MSLIDHLDQMADDIFTGDMLVLHLRHLKKEGIAGQDQVNETLAEVEWMKRRYTTLRLRAEAAIARVEIPDAPVHPREQAFREKVRVHESPGT